MVFPEFFFFIDFELFKKKNCSTLAYIHEPDYKNFIGDQLQIFQKQFSELSEETWVFAKKKSPDNFWFSFFSIYSGVEIWEKFDMIFDISNEVN